MKRLQWSLAVGVTVAVAGLAGMVVKAETSPDPGVEAKMDRLREHMRSTATALEAYRIDTNKYAAHTTDTQWSHGAGAMPDNVPTFRRYELSRREWSRPRQTSAMSLTTPIAYMIRMPNDPFSPTSAPLAYVSYPEAWLLWSPGPDGRYDLDWSEFDPKLASQPPSLFAAYSYDASNGVVSSGDIWYSKTNVEPDGGKGGSINLRASKPKSPAMEPGKSKILQRMGKTARNNEPWQDPDKNAELKKQLRYYETALESYFIDNNNHPPHTTDRAVKHGGEEMPGSVPTFRRHERHGVSSLTSPISYLAKFPADPFAQDASPFAYVGFQAKWLLWSPGPDGKYDLDWTEFDENATEQSPEFFARYSYDVTNGATSRGDIWLSKGRVGSVKFP